MTIAGRHPWRGSTGQSRVRADAHDRLLPWRRVRHRRPRDPRRRSCRSAVPRCRRRRRQASTTRLAPRASTSRRPWTTAISLSCGLPSTSTTSVLADTAHRLVVAGDSAGGNLAAVCAQIAKVDGPTLAAQLLRVSRGGPARRLPVPRTERRGLLPHHGRHARGSPPTTSAWRRPITADRRRWQPTLACPRCGLPISRASRLRRWSSRPSSTRSATRAMCTRKPADARRSGVKVEHRQFPGLIHGFYGLEKLQPDHRRRNDLDERATPHADQLATSTLACWSSGV